MTVNSTRSLFDGRGLGCRSFAPGAAPRQRRHHISVTIEPPDFRGILAHVNISEQSVYIYIKKGQASAE